MIIDRASPTIRKIRTEAERADAAVVALGLSLDGLGSNKRLNAINNTTRAIQTQGRTIESENRRAGASMRNLGRDTENLFGRLKRLATGFKNVGREIWTIARPAGMIYGLGTAIGVAVQAVGALSGGVVGLMPRLADLAGALAPAAIGFTGIGLAAVSAKLAFGGLSQAMNGNKNALRTLTPQARAFMAELRQMRPLMRGFQGAAQSGIFPGASVALRRFRANAPQLQGIVGRSAANLGGIIQTGANRFLNRGVLGDFSRISNTGNTVVRDMANGVFNLADAFRHLLVAAQPLTRWMSKVILGWTAHADVLARNGRESGRLTAYFNRTRVAMTNMGHILRNLWITFRNLGRDARPLGVELYTAAERTTAAWARLTSTTGSRVRLTQEFSSMGRSIRDLMNLVGELGGAIFRMGANNQLDRTVNGVRRLVPILERVLTTMANTFGPTMANTLVAFGNVIEDLTSAGGGPFMALLNILNMTLRAIHGIVNAAGPFKSVFASVFETALITRWLAKLGLITIGWNRVAVAASRAAVAENAAMGGGLVSGAARGAAGGRAGIGLGPVLGGLLGLGGGRGIRRLLGRGGAAAALERGAATGTMADFATGTAFGGEAAAAGAAGRFAGLGRIAGAAGRFAWPLALISGGLGALTTQRSGGIGHQIAQTAFGGINTALMGAPGAIAGLFGRDPNHQGPSTAEIQQRNALLRQEARARATVVMQLNQEAAQRATVRGGAIVAGLNRVYHQAGGGAAGIRAGVTAGFQQLNRYGGAGTTDMATRARIERALLHADPSTAARIMAFEGQHGRGVQIANGRIFRGGFNELTGLRHAITLPGANTGRIERSMIASMVASGISRGSAASSVAAFAGRGFTGSVLTRTQREAVEAAVAAVQLVKMARPGHPGRSLVPRHASGGRIGGTGLQDTVPVGGLAAPGELIVNRHTEARANSMLAPYGFSLGGLVGRESKRHSDRFAHGGRAQGLEGVKAGIRNVADAVMGKFPGLVVTSTTGGTHANNSYHYLGEAVDLGGPAALMNRAGTWIQAHMAGSLLEGIHNNTLSVKNGRPVSAMFWGPQTWAGHLNHIHLAAAGGGAATPTTGGGGRARARGPRIPMLGLSRGLGTATAGILGFGGLSIPGARAIGGGGGGAGAGAPGPGAGGVYSKNALRNLASSVGFPAASLNMAAAIALAESSGRANASNTNTNGSIDRGLWQINSIHGGLSTFDPLANARAALSISGGGHNWNPWTTYKTGAYKKFLARGGRQPRWGGWNASGLNNVFSTPTVIGVGERGAERVKVEPAGARSRGGGTMTNNFYITGDQGSVRREVEEALLSVARHLDLEPVDGSDTGGA